MLEAFHDEPSLEHLPRCPECEAILRPHVLWFDEFYNEHADYQWDRVLGASSVADTVLFVGTSFSVGVTDAIVQHATMRGADLVSIDPGATAPPYAGVRTLTVPAEELLPQLCEELGIAL
jgi:NAD-dependent deacetylase